MFYCVSQGCFTPSTVLYKTFNLFGCFTLDIYFLVCKVKFQWLFPKWDEGVSHDFHFETVFWNETVVWNTLVSFRKQSKHRFTDPLFHMKQSDCFTWNNSIVSIKTIRLFPKWDKRCFAYCFVLRRLFFSVQNKTYVYQFTRNVLTTIIIRTRPHHYTHGAKTDMVLGTDEREKERNKL